MRHKCLSVARAVCLLCVQVLARICLTESEFQRVLTNIIDLFTADGRLLEARGSLIIRKLCVLLNAKSIYMALADILQSRGDLEFVPLMVQTLNLILLTAAELEEVCVKIAFGSQLQISGVASSDVARAYDKYAM